MLIIEICCNIFFIIFEKLHGVVMNKLKCLKSLWWLKEWIKSGGMPRNCPMSKYTSSNECLWGVSPSARTLNEVESCCNLIRIGYKIAYFPTGNKWDEEKERFIIWRSGRWIFWWYIIWGFKKYIKFGEIW